MTNAFLCISKRKKERIRERGGKKKAPSTSLLLRGKRGEEVSRRGLRGGEEERTSNHLFFPETAWRGE